MYSFQCLPRFLTLCIAFVAICAKLSAISENQAEVIGLEAYIYGYPLVSMDQENKMTISAGVPMGQFAHPKPKNDHYNTDPSTNYADTLLSTAWLDLSQEPYFLHIPEMKNRYFSMTILSGWTDVITSLGSRWPKHNSGNYVLTGPQWNGPLPSSAKEIKSPTNLVWLIGRTYTSGAPNDVKEAQALADQYSIIPLNAYDEGIPSVKKEINYSDTMPIPIRDIVNKMNTTEYFNRLAAVLKDNPPNKKESEMLADMARVGIIPGEAFDPSKLDRKARRGFERGAKAALEKIKNYSRGLGKGKNGWEIKLKSGSYGKDYLQRAFVAYYGLGAGLPEDVLLPTISHDNRGKQLDGTLNRYILHFPKGQMPPVKGFWSIASYSGESASFLDLKDQYAVGPSNHVKLNTDGSLDIFVQNEIPADEHISNWLPIPKGRFSLVFQAYWPEKSLLEGTWQPPSVNKRLFEKRE